MYKDKQRLFHNNETILLSVDDNPRIVLVWSKTSDWIETYTILIYVIGTKLSFRKFMKLNNSLKNL